MTTNNILVDSVTAAEFPVEGSLAMQCLEIEGSYLVINNNVQSGPAESTSSFGFDPRRQVSLLQLLAEDV